jgi:hypothetical protein
MVTEPVTDGEAFGVRVSLQVRGACKPTGGAALTGHRLSAPRGGRSPTLGGAGRADPAARCHEVRRSASAAPQRDVSAGGSHTPAKSRLVRLRPLMNGVALGGSAVFPAASRRAMPSQVRQRPAPLRGPTYGPFIAVWRAGANQTRCEARRARQCKHWQFAAWRKRIVMTPRLPWIMSLVALAAGCATQSGLPPKSEASASSGSASHAHDVAELRHFYLLSPGPNATLVVTRSDLSDH